MRTGEVPPTPPCFSLPRCSVSGATAAKGPLRTRRGPRHAPDHGGTIEPWSESRYPSHQVRYCPTLHRDPGCRTGASQYLRAHISRYKYALVVFDRNGCGSSAPREEIQHAVERDLAVNGWRGRSKAIVIDPELEAWVWNGSNHVSEVFGWVGGYERLKSWLGSQGLWPSSSAKPPDPKKAMKASLREVQRSDSASLFGQLAVSTTLRRCRDSAFNELRATLQHWLPAV